MKATTGSRLPTYLGPLRAYALAVHPRTQDFYMANDLGLLRSSDGGESWNTLRERGNESWLSVKIRFDPANDDAIYSDYRPAIVGNYGRRRNLGVDRPIARSNALV